MVRWLQKLSRGFGYLTLGPSPRLRRLREELERTASPVAWYGRPLPPLPDSAYPPGAVPLDCTGVPDADPRECGHRLPDGRERIHAPWRGWSTTDGNRAFLREP